MIETYANAPFSYQYNVNLDGSMTWTANASIVALGYEDIIDTSGNTDISSITATIDVSNTNLPNPNNFSVTLSANAYQTNLYVAGGVDPTERVVVIQTAFFSNTGIKVHGNNIFLRVLASTL